MCSVVHAKHSTFVKGPFLGASSLYVFSFVFAGAGVLFVFLGPRSTIRLLNVFCRGMWWCTQSTTCLLKLCRRASKAQNVLKILSSAVLGYYFHWFVQLQECCSATLPSSNNDNNNSNHNIDKHKF